MDEHKKQALKIALAQIDKQFGKGSVMFLGDEDANSDIEVVSTGSLSFRHCARCWWITKRTCR